MPLVNIEHFIANRIAFSQGKSFTRTIIRFTIASVALSIAVIILTSAVITGFKNEITEKIFGFWGHIDVTHNTIRRNFEAVPFDQHAAFVDSIRAIEQVTIERYSEDATGLPELTTAETGIKHVQAICLSPGIIKTKTDFESIIVKGIGRDFDWSNLESFILDGRRIEFAESGASDDILISEVTARRLSLEVGQSIIVTLFKNRDQIQRKFTISGIYKTGLEEYDKRFALADMREIQNVFGWEDNQVMGLEVFVDDIDDLELMNEYVNHYILPHYMYSETVRRKFPWIFGWLDLQNINEYVILILMTVVTIINMITGLLILILERTQMIGVLKAIGCSNWSIRKIFLYQAIKIIKWGLIIGNAAGLIICFIQAKFKIIKLNEDNYYLSSAPIEVDPLRIILLNMAVVLIILLFLVIPTYLISRISPVKVLHFK